jgi:hypothetical protein
MNTRELKQRTDRLVYAMLNSDANAVDELIFREWPARHVAKDHLARVGIKLPRKRSVKTSPTIKGSRLLAVLSDLLREDPESYADIGRRHSVSRQYVSLLSRQAKDNGITCH